MNAFLVITNLAAMGFVYFGYYPNFPILVLLLDTILVLTSRRTVRVVSRASQDALDDLRKAYKKLSKASRNAPKSTNIRRSPARSR